MAGVSDNILKTSLRSELGIPSGDDTRINEAIATAKIYVAGAVGDADIDANVWRECVVCCAADLYNSKSARLGVMDVGSPDGVQPYRVPLDPLRSVWPKLNAAGLLTGRSVIA